MLTIMSNHYLEVAWLNGQLQRMVVVLQLLAANLKRYIELYHLLAIPFAGVGHRHRCLHLTVGSHLIV